MKLICHIHFKCPPDIFYHRLFPLCRCGYHPDQYPSEREWGARLMMERSKAIKSPSIHYHLAGTKKVRDNHVMMVKV